MYIGQSENQLKSTDYSICHMAMKLFICALVCMCKCIYLGSVKNILFRNDSKGVFRQNMRWFLGVPRFYTKSTQMVALHFCPTNIRCFPFTSMEARTTDKFKHPFPVSLRPLASFGGFIFVQLRPSGCARSDALCLEIHWFYGYVSFFRVRGGFVEWKCNHTVRREFRQGAAN